MQSGWIPVSLIHMFVTDLQRTRSFTRLIAAMVMTCTAVACNEGSPSAPTNRLEIQSFAAGLPQRFGNDQVAPDYSGAWIGEYLLTSCRSAHAGGCKDFPQRRAVRMDLIQQGTQLTGMMDFLGSRRAFAGFVSEGPGVSSSDAGADSRISVRLVQAGSTLSGMIVTDSFAESFLNLSKKYDVVTPLQRTP
jgi:hypothetical protein